MSGFLAAISGLSALAHGTTAGDRPVRPQIIRVRHRSPADIVALFASEHLPKPSTLRTLRGARAGGAESVLPTGIDGVLRNRAPADEVVVAGVSGLEELERCIRVLDAPVETLAPGRVRVVLRLAHASAREVRLRVLQLPGRSAATASGATLTLKGSPEWLHRALRWVIRAELNLPIKPEVPIV